jgi:predicted  nucleic acid-binding Zn-ribbon protein
MKELLKQLAELNDKYLELKIENESLKKEVYQLKIALVLERQKNKQLTNKEK